MLKDIKYTGINTASNAYDAPAGQLAVAHNVVNERGYIETLAPPVQVVNYEDYQLSGYKCVFRHDMLSGTSNYIFYKPGTSVGSLQWLSVIPGVHGTEVTWIPGSPVKTSIADEDNLFEITAVGNTLCVLTAAGMDYLAWNGTTYVEIGTNIPEVNIWFGLKMDKDVEFVEEWTNGDEYPTSDSDITRLDNGIHAAINEYADSCHKDGKFMYAFLVRYALRLFDGSLVHHSSPVLMCVNNWCAPTMQIRAKYSSVNHNYMHQLYVYLMSGRLMMSIREQIPSLWRDVVTGVEIFASAPLQKFPDGQKPTSWNTPITYVESGDIEVWEDGFGGYGYGRTNGSFSSYVKRGLKELILSDSNTSQYAKRDYWDINYQVVYRNLDINVQDVGLFYKIFEFNADYADSSSILQNWVEVDTGDLTSITTKQLMSDDYDSHDVKIPQHAYFYNQRINLYNLLNKVTLPFKARTYQPYLKDSSTDAYDYQLAVKVRNDNGEEVWLGTALDSNMNTMAANIMYLFIPINNILEARLIRKLTSASAYYEYYSIPLQKHRTLNGYVWFDDFSSPSIVDIRPDVMPMANQQLIKEFPNKIYTSEVGNPFYFPIGGINTIGTGKIIALASNVRAISQGQFGEYPLYVFTDNGIWMMEVDDKGLYKAKQPMSFDVIKPGSKVTSVDNAVAYVIERGLMLVSGGDTRCISEVLDGKPEEIPDLLGGVTSQSNRERWEIYKDGVSCAYDEAHQRLHVYNPGFDYHYVYSVRTGLWTTEDDVSPLLSTLNGKYVNTEGGLLDMSLSDSTADYRTQTILTRPISFETDAYKRLRDNIQRGDIDVLRTSDHAISVLVQGTDDLIHWHNIAGVTRHYRIVRKSGTPHKWFRWKIVIGSSPEEYRLHGLTADIDVTGNNKLR